MLLLAYFALGRLLIWTSQIAGPLEPIRKLAPSLFECDFCLGCWIYAALAAWFGINATSEMTYIPAVSEAVTGISASFVMHLIRIGWECKFNG